jgi:hypothetical protein
MPTNVRALLICGAVVLAVVAVYRVYFLPLKRYPAFVAASDHTIQLVRDCDQKMAADRKLFDQCTETATHSLHDTQNLVISWRENMEANAINRYLGNVIDCRRDRDNSDTSAEARNRLSYLQGYRRTMDLWEHTD